jgi:hypothetical protein
LICSNDEFESIKLLFTKKSNPSHHNNMVLVGGLPTENGGWPPHLHFQLIRDIQHYHGDYPGVCAKRDVDFYACNCPDPASFE